jgi:hypothetical protein
LSWPESEVFHRHPEYASICREWLSEMHRAARWVVGDRDLARAYPTERLWSGLPTCCGQMTLPPLAAIYAGDPSAAYRAAYHLAFFDNGWGKDLNAAWIAALAGALTLKFDESDRAGAWRQLFEMMRRTDPYAYAQVPWTYRSVDRWLDLALDTAEKSQRRPAALFKRLNLEFRETIKWEAQVPFVVAISSAVICDYDPRAAMQLSIEWGHDTDSDAQLLGAMVGALHGPDVFPSALRGTVADRLKLDYGQDIHEWVELLVDLHRLAGTQTIVRTT